MHDPFVGDSSLVISLGPWLGILEERERGPRRRGVRCVASIVDSTVVAGMGSLWDGRRRHAQQ